MSDDRALTPSQWEHVGLEIEDGVALLTLRRPAQRNAFTQAMALDFIAACDIIDARADVGAVVLTGEGPTFCAGADRAILDGAGADPTHPDHFDAVGSIYDAFSRLGQLEPPVIAAVRGAAVGAGLNLMLCADLRIVADDALLMSGFLRLGIHPGGGHFALVARLAGREAAAALGIFGASVDGPRAVDLGLAWEHHPAELVEARAIELARAVAVDPALARVMARSLRSTTRPAVDGELALEAERAPQLWSLRRRALRA
jgi:enoyl-CoA hydratase